MDEIGAAGKPEFNPRIDPDMRVAKEDYFRTVKDHKQMNKLQAKQSEKTMARTRFDG